VDAGEQQRAGVVTVLLADAEGTARHQDPAPGAVAPALAELGVLVEEAVAGHGGVRLAGQGTDRRFAAAFPAAPDAVACALNLQRAWPEPARLRVCVHTGDALRLGEVSSASLAVDRAARLLELAHGGQALLSGAAADLVAGRLPDGVWLADLGCHRLADLAPAVRVWQLCQPDAGVDFPPLRTLDAFAHNLPVQLTSFIGRDAEMAEVRRHLAGSRLVTLTGAGGAGKTRLALQVAAGLLTGFPAGVWLADLAPLTDAELVPVAVARALGLPDEQGRLAMSTVAGFVAAGRALIVLDNCEHLLDACAALAEDLLRACPLLVILATSREPVGAAGEVTWRVPSLPLDAEAVELFADRARRARPGFTVTAENGAAVAEICRRLDGMPLAIELAAARLRAFSPAEIAAGLHDQFRLLTGGSRTAVRRQQTLRASVDWSHALLTAPERVLFRRLAAFASGFDLWAAQAVGAGQGLERHQVLDQLALLVDKSLVAAEESQSATRYRLLETVRQYAAEKLAESGEAGQVRTRHRDHYIAIARRLDAPGDADADGGPRQLIKSLEAEIDNLRAAFEWSLELSDQQAALRLASSLQPMWQGRCRMLEGLAWFDTALAAQPAGAEPVAPEVRARALADAALLGGYTATPRRGMPWAEEAIVLARTLGDPALLGRALLGAAFAAGYLADTGRPYFEEAAALARQAGDDRSLAQILARQAFGALVSGDLVAVRTAAEEGLALAERAGNDHLSWSCRTWLGWALIFQGDLHAGKSVVSGVVAEAEAARHPWWKMWSLAYLGFAHACLGQPDQARAAGEASIAIASNLGLPAAANAGYICLFLAAMASGDGGALREACQAALQLTDLPETSLPHRVDMIEAHLAAADLPAAREQADEAVADAAKMGAKLSLMAALLASARVAAAAGDAARASDDAHATLTVAGGIESRIGIIDALECLGGLPGSSHEQHKGARLLGAASALRQATGYQRFRIHRRAYDAAVLQLRTAMGDDAFDRAWHEGAALTPGDAVNYALRGRGERSRPEIGWLSLTPAEREVARLVSEGLANKAIAAALFVSPRTVQTHLTHMYAKLGVTSRVQLAQQAARHA